MTKRELDIQGFIINWNYALKRARELEEDIAEMQIAITQNYSATGINGKGCSSNKIERYCIRKNEKELELISIRNKIEAIITALKSEVFSEIEMSVVYAMIEGYTLSRFAIKRGIYISHVYKIKDKAIRKLAENIKENTF